MSVLDELRQRREQLKNRDLSKDLEVPGYQGKLVVRFTPVPDDAADRWQLARYRRLMPSANDDADSGDLRKVDADVIVKSCREILTREGEKLVPLVPGEVTTFATIDEVLGFESDTAIEAVGELYPSSRAVRSCAAELMDWTEEADEAADEQLAGESVGGPSSSQPPDSNGSE